MDAINEGTFGNAFPTGVFLDPLSWADCYERYPKNERGIRLDSVRNPHFVINGVPVLMSSLQEPGIIMVVNHEHPFDSKYNFAIKAK